MKRLAVGRETAKRILEQVNRAAAELDASLILVQDVESREAFEAYRSAVANVLGSSFEHIVGPLWEQFPELEPRDPDKEAK